MTDDATVLLNISAIDEMKEQVKKILLQVKGMKDVYNIRIDDTNLSAFAKLNEKEISGYLDQIKHIHGVKDARARVLVPLH